MVLESYLSTALPSALKDYIQGAAPNAISLPLPRGRLELHNVQLNLPSINSTVLATTPLLLTHGTVGRIKVGMQWSTLRTSPFGVEIADIRIVVAARPGYCVDQHKVRASVDAAKAAALDAIVNTLLYSINTP